MFNEVVNHLDSQEHIETTKIISGILFSTTFCFLFKVDTTYINIIINPPRKARIKIKGIHGLLVWIHFNIIIVDTIIKMAGIRIKGEDVRSIMVDTITKKFWINIQNLVYSKF